MNTVSFSVPGVPHGRPRPNARAMKTKSGKWIAQVYHPKPSKNPRPGNKKDEAWARAHAWFAAVKAAAAGRMPPEPWDGPVWLSIDVYFPRPQRLAKKASPPGRIPHLARPDRDNLDKAVLDALKEAGLFQDDSQVYCGGVAKWYVAQGCGPGVRIRARLITGDVQDPSDVVREVADWLARGATGARQGNTVFNCGPRDALEAAQRLRSIL